MALVKIITGPKNSGKTTAAMKLIEKIRNEGGRPGGFISAAETIEKKAYNLVEIRTNRRIPAVREEFAASDSISGWEKYDFSRFYFNRTAYSEAEAIILDMLKLPMDEQPDAVFLDELGPLELRGGGFMNAALSLIPDFRGTVCLVVRDSLVDEIMKKLGLSRDSVEISAVNPPGAL